MQATANLLAALCTRCFLLTSSAIRQASQFCLINLRHTNLQKPFTFRPPTEVHQVGSVPLGAAVRQAPCLDLAVELPQECFDSKDQLNHRRVKGPSGIG